MLSKEFELLYQKCAHYVRNRSIVIQGDIKVDANSRVCAVYASFCVYILDYVRCVARVVCVHIYVKFLLFAKRQPRRRRRLKYFRHLLYILRIILLYIIHT